MKARVVLVAALGALAAWSSATPSPSAPAAAQDAAQCRVVENFASAPVGALPPDWHVRDEGGRSVYAVVAEGPLRFLRASSVGLGIQAAKPFEWDLQEYPVLAWSWRPLEFPQGADEQNGKNDSALAVYMLVPHSRVRGPRALKYIWSERVPAGTRLESNQGLTQVLVLRTGTNGRGRWVEERVNVRDDFRQRFNEADVPKPAGIAVLTDADDTQSRARGDYANFRICRS